MIDAGILEDLEERKKIEIEHSRIRRTILQGYERHSDTHSAEEADRLKTLIRDQKAFQQHFSNTKFYSITQVSEKYQYDWLKSRCSKHTLVLDFACGNGENGIYAAQCGARVVGIDISPEGVANANLNAAQAGIAERCHFTVMDGEHMTFPDNTFDLGVEYGALHHVELNAAMKELCRVLKPGGEMICVEALKHNPFIHRYRKKTPHLRTQWEVEHILGVEDLDVVAKYFEKISIRFFHLAVLAAVPFRKTFLFKPLRIILDTIDRLMLNATFVGKYAWIMIFVVQNPRKEI